MAIYPPKPTLTPTEKRILEILAESIVEAPPGKHGDNVPSGQTPISDQAAERLLPLLEEYVASKRFQQRARFVEALSDPSGNKVARDLYLSGRTEHGRTRVAASWQWGSFQLRIGMGREITRGSSGSYMPFDHFLEMESRLLQTLPLHPRVRTLILDFVESRRQDVEDIRWGQHVLQYGAVRSVPQALISQLQSERTRDNDYVIPLRKAVAMAALTTDLSVMFTTRDWGVAGTLSAMAAAAPPMIT